MVAIHYIRKIERNVDSMESGKISFDEFYAINRSIWSAIRKNTSMKSNILDVLNEWPWIAGI